MLLKLTTLEHGHDKACVELTLEHNSVNAPIQLNANGKARVQR